jgi:hypothetical protein
MEVLFFADRVRSPSESINWKLDGARKPLFSKLSGQVDSPNFA